MQILRTLMAAGLAAVAYGQTLSRPEVVEVRAVMDGQTLEVAGRGRVRLAGIHAPRPPRGAVDGEPFGQEARARLESLVAHRFVRLEFPSIGSQSSAYVLLEDGTFVNATLVREGLARVTGRATDLRGAQLKRAQEEAAGAHRGLWRHQFRSPTRNW